MPQISRMVAAPDHANERAQGTNDDAASSVRLPLFTITNFEGSTKLFYDKPPAQAA